MLYQFLYVPYMPVIVLGAVLVLWDIAAGIRRADTPAQGIRWLWAADHWPGTDKWAEMRRYIGRICYLLAMAAYLAWNTVSNAGWQGTSAVCNALFSTMLLLCLAKTLLLTKYSFRQFALVLVCLLPLLCAAAYAQNMVFLATYFLLLAAEGVDMRPVLQVGTALTAVLAAAVIISQRMGFISMDGLGDDNYLRTVQHKFALGFLHPNTTGYILAFVAMAWYLLRYKRLKWWDIGGILGLAAVIGFVAKSRASLLTIVIMLLLGEALRYFRVLRKKTWMHVLLCGIPSGLALLSFFAAAFYNESGAVWEKINGAVSGRLYLMQKTLHTFGPTWFGQDIRSEKLFTLDNVYLYLFYRLGVVCFVLFLAGMTLLLWRFLKRECYGEAAALIAVLCMGMMECIVFWPAVSIAMWQLPTILWNEKLRPISEGADIWQMIKPKSAEE